MPCFASPFMHAEVCFAATLTPRNNPPNSIPLPDVLSDPGPDAHSAPQPNRTGTPDTSPNLDALLKFRASGTGQTSRTSCHHRECLCRGDCRSLDKCNLFQSLVCCLDSLSRSRSPPKSTELCSAAYAHDLTSRIRSAASANAFHRSGDRRKILSTSRRFSFRRWFAFLRSRFSFRFIKYLSPAPVCASAACVTLHPFRQTL